MHPLAAALDSFNRKERNLLVRAMLAEGGPWCGTSTNSARIPIICVGLNYVDHSNESGFAVPEFPTIFSRFASSLIGPGTAIVRPRASEQLDYEGELVAVIGKGGRYIPKARALEHVAPGASSTGMCCG
jgi:2-keto-4-pentenoate hydratase/2-oxohepta-3-ene-1,7-dioic acid hydratase in catechol pathway